VQSLLQMRVFLLPYERKIKHIALREKLNILCNISSVYLNIFNNLILADIQI